jgi:hypothetical protein
MYLREQEHRTYRDAATDRSVQQLSAQAMEAIAKQKGPAKPVDGNQAVPLETITESKEGSPEPGELTDNPAKDTETTPPFPQVKTTVITQGKPKSPPGDKNKKTASPPLQSESTITA